MPDENRFERALTGTPKATRPGRRVATLYVRPIPLNLKNEFKAHCAKYDMSLKDGIEFAMRAAIKSGISPREFSRKYSAG